MDTVQKQDSFGQEQSDHSNFVGSSAFEGNDSMPSFSPPASGPEASTLQMKKGPSSTPVQRLVAVGNNVYAPRSVRRSQAANFNIGTYTAGLQTILGGNPAVQTGAGLTTDMNLAGVNVQADRQTLMQQFNDENTVYSYNNAWALPGAVPTATHAIMEPADMGDNSAAVPGGYVAGQACVIQALNSLGKNVPGTGAVGTNQQHHQYSVNQGLDYRTDSDYLNLYVNHYGLTLEHSGVMGWGAINWANLGGAGDYLCVTYINNPAPGAVGHMVGVRVTANAHGGFNEQIFDQQGITAGTLNAGNGFVKYIFT